jgi:hypothetical protein
MAAKPLPEAPAGEAALPAEPVEKTKYWNAGDDDEEPITGDELTSHLDEAAAVTPPEEQEEVATELASMGGGPDTAVASGNWGLTKKAAEGKKEKGEQKKN